MICEMPQRVRITEVGARDGLPSDIVGLLEEAESVTQKNTGLVLIVAFNYGGRQEIAAAARTLEPARPARRGRAASCPAPRARLTWTWDRTAGYTTPRSRRGRCK